MKRAREVNNVHAKVFTPESISLLSGGDVLNGEVSSSEKDLETLRTDPVGEAVAAFGELNSKIESLANLRSIRGGRAEIAMLSLARGYVLTCVERQGSWTSGVHLLWWTKKRLAEPPEIDIRDIRDMPGVQLTRQVALIVWSIYMLRLTFIDDIAAHARDSHHALAKVHGLASRSAADVQTFNPKKLSRWLSQVAAPQLDEALPGDEYKAISNALHVDPVQG